MSGDMVSASNSIGRLRKIPSLGVRSGLLASFLVIAGFGGLASLAAVLAIIRVSGSVEPVIGDRLPVALTALTLARDADALVVAAAPLVSATAEAARAERWQDIEIRIANLREVSARLGSASSGGRTAIIGPIADALVTNLGKLDGLVRDRVAVIQTLRSVKGALLANLQSFHERTNHLSRLLNSDAAVMQRQSKEANALVRPLAEEMAGLVPAAGLEAAVNEVNGMLLVASDAPTADDLATDKAIVDLRLWKVDRIAAQIDPALSAALAGSMHDLRELALGEGGIIALRANELRILDDLARLMEENSRISRQMDDATRTVVAESLSGVERAMSAVSEVKTTSLTVLLGVIFAMVLGVGLLMQFYVNSHLLRRLAWLNEAMLAIADGRFEVAMPPQGADELGRLGAAVAKFRATAMEAEARELHLRALNVQGEERVASLQKEQDVLVRRASTDFLTGIPNRQGFMETAEREWERLRRDDGLAALLMLDLDLFKQINDHYGHPTGDRVLQVVATHCRDALRPTDLLGRLGGEEFAALLPGATLQGGMDAAERIRQAVANAAVSADDGSIVRLTVSVGVASRWREDISLAEALGRADAALYSAKQAGRNQVGVEFGA
jgi:diguanylate cyclase (GGDEF)-like protein